MAACALQPYALEFSLQLADAVVLDESRDHTLVVASALLSRLVRPVEVMLGRRCADEDACLTVFPSMLHLLNFPQQIRAQTMMRAAAMLRSFADC